jgi:glycosyltransferase involved in cell wall biosynthesis
MKILQVTPRYRPHTGGVETHVAELSERLVARGHDVTVFAADAEEGLPRRETRDGVRVRRFRGFAPGGAFHVAPGIAPAVRRVAPDVIHAHNYHSLPVFFAALGTEFGTSAGGGGEGPRFVVTPHYHGGSASGFRDRLLSLYRPLGGWALDRADELIAVSDWERDRLRADFGVEATVIPNGLNVERFADATPEERDRPYLLCVGRLEEYKGVQHAIRALSVLPEYDLLVAGSGDFREELEAIARREGVASRVEFLGYVPDERLPRLYAGASAYLALSEFEAYGMTVAESLTAKTPCVVRESGALLDWADRPDCASVARVAPEAVARAADEAVGRDAPAAALPTWEDVTDRVLSRYE